MKHIIEIALLLIAAYYIGLVYFQYRKTTGTFWERIIPAAGNSATMLWGKFVLVLSAIVSQLNNIADLLGQPEIKDYIQATLGNPKSVATVMALIAIITMIARTRTLK